MTRARVFALLAFIAIGAAGGSLILGEPVWFAWSAVLGAIALVIWGRTHDQPAPPPQPRQPPEFGCGFTSFDFYVLDEDPAALRPIWPVPTNHFGAPE